MNTKIKLDSSKTALLTLDVQKGVLGFVPGAEKILSNCVKVVEAARKNQFTVLHVGIGFEPGYPEVGPRASTFLMVKERGLFVKGSESAEIHPSLVKAGETIIYKQRYSAFSENSLNMILRAKGIENLVLFGISTSGIVLSTLRQAFDLDYKCVVIKDACLDRDEEVHRVLTEKVFTAQATVLTAREFEEQAAGE
jgi:nicotinamidase-related amidase